MDRQGVLLNGSGNPEFSATSPSHFASVHPHICSFIHSLFTYPFIWDRASLHGSQYGDKAGLELQRFASALSAGIKCMPPCLTSWGLQTVHLEDSFGLTTIIPRRGLHGALTLRLHSWQLNPQADEHFGKAVIKMHLGSTYLSLIRPWVSMEIPLFVRGTSSPVVADLGPSRGHRQLWAMDGQPSPFHP